MSEQRRIIVEKEQVEHLKWMLGVITNGKTADVVRSLVDRWERSAPIEKR